MNNALRELLSLLQPGKQIQQASPTHPQLTSKTPEEWHTYWQTQGQPWRTEPEIDIERQKELDKRRAIVPDIKKSVYPFKGMKLSRADVEWLLATHANGRGPVDWNDESQRTREGLDLRGADLRLVGLQGLPLACLQGSLKWNAQPNITQEQRAQALVHLEGANLRRAHLEGAILAEAHLEQQDLNGVHLEHAYLLRTHLEEAHLWGGHIERANLIGAYLEGALLGSVVLADEKHVGPVVVDTRWSNTNLAIVDWSQVNMLGDEYKVRKIMRDAQVKDRVEWLWQYDRAVRANRQLAVALQSQGLNEDAARFAYRAQVLQKSVLWYQMTRAGAPFRQRMQALGSWLFSWFLFLLAGYGYKPIRSVIAYLVIVFGFMGLYLLNAHFIAPHLTWDEALVLSVSSFHGRGFFTQNVTLGDTYARLAAIEAVVGLFIEISFIATFTQRFFGK
jgi:uncharacterized protein YjbI with pentapeptide repeats